jgi:RNA polymerase-binding transcription factor DksA
MSPARIEVDAVDAIRSRERRRRSRLDETRETLSRELRAVDIELVQTRAMRGNGADDDEHDPDGIPLSSVLQLLEGQRARLVAGLRDADRATTDLADGRYGSCQSCARAIPEDRLEIKPTTRTCVTCAR